MSVLIFRLNGASEEEAAEMRELLEQYDLPFYETSAGRWGISLAGLWLEDEGQKHRARELIEQYQSERQQRFECWWAEQPGFLVSLWHSFLARPIPFVLTAILLLAITFISLSPFVHMAA
ncbi:MAG: hypothetical protein ACJAYG_000487 [Oceanicoccus sp.]|jgi:hypothetical protein